MRIKRTYPQPDSPAPNIGPRERALAVFKYLLNLEPEVAKEHQLFACIKHAFEQAIALAIEERTRPMAGPNLEPSLVEQLSSEVSIEPVQGEKL